MTPNRIHRDDSESKLEGIPLNSDEIHKDLDIHLSMKEVRWKSFRHTFLTLSNLCIDHCRESREDYPEALAQLYIIDFNRKASRFGFPITMSLCRWGGRYGGS